MNRGRLASGSYLEAGSFYRTRGGAVVKCVEVRDTGHRLFDRAWRDLGPASLIIVERVDLTQYGVHWDGRYLPRGDDDQDLIRRAFRP
jgi:hypothetical protein